MQDELHHNEGAFITVGPIYLDTLRNEVSVNAKKRRLTPMESKMLQFLAVNANTVCTSNQIGSHVWGGDIGLTKVYIHHLRQKIELDPKHPIYLLTIPEVSYTLVTHDQDEVRQT